MGRFDLGKIHIYTGDGKGKTTASLGLAFRTIGQGNKVAIVQFLKSPYTGEYYHSERIPNLDFFVFGVKCENDEQHKKELAAGTFKGFCKNCFKAYAPDREEALRALSKAKECAQNGEYNMVILDEANVAYKKELITLSEIDDLLANKHPQTEMVLTGRGADEELCKRADLVTEMKIIKHYMDKGVPARKGVEF